MYVFLHLIHRSLILNYIISPSVMRDVSGSRIFAVIHSSFTVLFVGRLSITHSVEPILHVLRV